MRPISHQLLAVVPIFFGFLLVLFSGIPLEGGVISYTPNIAALLTLVLAGSPRFSWPRGVAFAFGLLQDILFGTPLGAQALLVLLLAQWAHMEQVAGGGPLLFRLRWLKATATLIVWHALLWCILRLVGHQPPALANMLIAGAINGLWYPLFYWLMGRESNA